MTREDAIYWIKNLAVLSTEKDMPQIEEALNMAIEALADRKTENSSEKPNNCEDEPLTCDGNCWMKKQNGEWLCEHCQRKPQTEPTGYNLSPVDKDINVCSKTEPQTETKVEPTWVGVTYGKWEAPPKVDLPTGEITTCVSVLASALEIEDEPQTDCCETCKHKNDGCYSEACGPCSITNSNYEPQTDCSWK